MFLGGGGWLREVSGGGGGGWWGRVSEIFVLWIDIQKKKNLFWRAGGGAGVNVGGGLVWGRAGVSELFYYESKFKITRKLCL